MAGAVDSAAHVRGRAVCTFWGGRSAAYHVRQRRIAGWNSAGDRGSGWVLDGRGDGMDSDPRTRETRARRNSYHVALSYFPYSGGRLLATSCQISAVDDSTANDCIRVAPLAEKEDGFRVDFDSYLVSASKPAH